MVSLSRLLPTALVLRQIPTAVAARSVSTERRSTESAVKGAMMGALISDALCLGTHYEYDAVKIKNFYGKIDQYYAPGEKTGGETHGEFGVATEFQNK